MFPILFILLCLVVLTAVMGPMAGHRGSERESDSPRHNRAFDILDQRLAKGEIDSSEYDEKHRTIAQGH
jgi:putative membrane protein